MSEFAGFETVQELSRGAEAVVHRARRTGAKHPSFVVKVFSPFAAGGDPASTARECDAFVRAASAQKKAALSREACWAPVHAAGADRDKGQAFQVTDYFPTSAQKLILGRVRLSQRALCTIARAVLKGVAEIERECGRPHGNIKASNVLMGRGRDIPRTRIVLTDPARMPEGKPAGPGSSDLRDLGRLLYELVTHHPYTPATGWPFRASPEWAKLGKKSAGWMDFCNRLLHPRTLMSAEDAALALDRLEGRGEGRARWLAAAAVLAAAALAAVVAFTPALRERPAVRAVRARAAGVVAALRNLLPEAKKDDFAGTWAQLCADYGEWFGPLQRQLDAARRDRWGQDPHLRELLARMDRAAAENVELDPRAIVGATATHLAYIKDNPPEAALAVETQGAIRAALEVIAGVKAGLRADQWPLRAKAEELALRYKQRGWDALAQHLGGVTSALGDPPGVGVADAVDGLLALAPPMEAIEARWGELESRKAAGPDPFLDGLLEQVSQFHGSLTIAGAQQAQAAVLQLLELLKGANPSEEEISITGSPAINDFWRKSCTLIASRCATFRDLVEETGRLRRLLCDLDWYVAVNPVRGAADLTAAWPEPALAALWDRREATLRELLATLSVAGGVPDKAVGQLAAMPEWTTPLREYEAQRAKAETPPRR